MAPGSVLTPKVSYTLSNSLTAPLFLQKDSRWAGDDYYSNKAKTIGDVGCNLTSVTMITKYFGNFAGSTATIDPGDYNRWLDQQGFTTDAAAQMTADVYARSKGFKVFYPANPVVSRNDVLLDEYLRTGNPVELQVNSSQSSTGIHFVVATGIVTENGISTYAINDPIFGRSTLYAKYGNSYNSLTKFSTTAVDVQKFIAAVGPKGSPFAASGTPTQTLPVEIVVTDPLGRRTGYDPGTKVHYDEIPGAVYITQAVANSDGSGAAFTEKYVLVGQPEDGDYLVQVLGTGSGEYALDVAAVSWGGYLNVLNFGGSVVDGSSRTETIPYNSGAGIPESIYYLPAVMK